LHRKLKLTVERVDADYILATYQDAKKHRHIKQNKAPKKAKYSLNY